MFKLHLISLLFVVIVYELSYVSSEATFHIMYCPKSLEFDGSEPLKSSSLADFLSLSLGYTLPKPLEWKSFTAITDVFSLAKSSLTLTINGGLNLKSIHKFPFVESESLGTEFEILSQRSQSIFSDKKLILLKFNSFEKDSFLNQINANILSPQFDDTLDQRLSKALQNKDLKSFIENNGIDESDPNIKGLLLEMETIIQTLEWLRKLKTSDNKFNTIRSVIWFDSKYFGRIIEDNNYEESVRNGAKTLITNLVEKMERDLRDIYENRIIFTVIEKVSPINPILVRKVRASNDEKDTNNKTLNLAHNFDPNFHTAFAMIGFTTILIAISVFGISVSMWNLDPGKDSIIYRMTSQRIKKDQ